jgi:hypothetical protein
LLRGASLQFIFTVESDIAPSANQAVSGSLETPYQFASLRISDFALLFP